MREAAKSNLKSSNTTTPIYKKQERSRGRALPESGDEKEDDHRGGRARRRTQQSDRTAQPEQRGRRGEGKQKGEKWGKSPSPSVLSLTNCCRSERRHLN